MPRALPIYTYDHPILRERCKEVELPIADSIKELAENMLHTMLDANGLGLSANQVGRTERLFVMIPRLHQGASTKGTVLINPVITNLGEEEVDSTEGCLSMPKLEFKVKRKKTFTVTFTDLESIEHTIDIPESDYIASAIIQHEIDHLDGILLIDKAESVSEDQQMRLKRIKSGQVRTRYFTISK